MSKISRKGPQKVDLTKPCKCGTGFYCHRHWKYACADLWTPKLFKVSVIKSKRPKTGAKADSHGGQW